MRTFKFCALDSGYSLTVGNNARKQELEGGLPRQVIAIVGAVHRVTAQIYLEDALKRQIFWTFWRENLTKLWNWNLVLDNGISEDCICQFDVESVPVEVETHGKKLIIQISVLVCPIKRDPDFDKWLLDMWENDKLSDLSDIEKIPNVWMPAATGV